MASKFPRPQQLILISEILTDVRKYNVCYADNVKVEIERQLQTLLTVRYSYPPSKNSFYVRSISQLCQQSTKNTHTTMDGQSEWSN